MWLHVIPVPIASKDYVTPFTVSDTFAGFTGPWILTYTIIYKKLFVLN